MTFRKELKQEKMSKVNHELADVIDKMEAVGGEKPAPWRIEANKK